MEISHSPNSTGNYSFSGIYYYIIYMEITVTVIYWNLKLQDKIWNLVLQWKLLLLYVLEFNLAYTIISYAPIPHPL